MELSKASSDAISYAIKVFLKNKDLLNEGFTPETDNTMEQIFSLICDFINAARSFKSSNGLPSFCYNLFTHFNKRPFCTGKWRGFSPLIRARFQYGSARKIALYDAQSIAIAVEKCQKKEEHTFVEGKKKKLSKLHWNLKIFLKMEQNQKKLKRLIICFGTNLHYT
jgi:hypothetical protein